jgi:hypothetical protein
MVQVKSPQILILSFKSRDPLQKVCLISRWRLLRRHPLFFSATRLSVKVLQLILELEVLILKNIYLFLKRVSRDVKGLLQLYDLFFELFIFMNLLLEVLTQNAHSLVHRDH